MGIVRTMVELRAAYFYLCIEKCDDHEWDCRWNAFNLHDCLARKKLMETIGNKDDPGKIDETAAELRERLEKNSFFESLDSGLKKQVLNGNAAYLFSLENILERAGLAVSQFRFIYMFFSSHVHGLPLSFYRMGRDFEDRGRGVHSKIEEGYTVLCVSLALTLLTASRDEFRVMFKDLIHR